MRRVRGCALICVISPLDHLVLPHHRQVRVGVGPWTSWEVTADTAAATDPSARGGQLDSRPLSSAHLALEHGSRGGCLRILLDGCRGIVVLIHLLDCHCDPTVDVELDAAEGGGARRVVCCGALLVGGFLWSRLRTSDTGSRLEPLRLAAGFWLVSGSLSWMKPAGSRLALPTPPQLQPRQRVRR